MQISGTAPVVVGVNGTAACLAAVRLAARESVARQVPLRVVHAFAWPSWDTSAGGVPYDLLRRRAGEVLERAVATATRSAPAARVTGYLVDGMPTRVLMQQSRTASLLVLGGDDQGAVVRMPTDSVLVQCVARARCPAMVARGSGPPAGPVLAGVDGSPVAVLALRWAAAEAARRHTGLEVLHVTPEHGGPPAQEAQRLLDAAVAAVPDAHPVHASLVTGDPATALVRAASRAQLLVVGPRGAGGRVGTLLGSVAQTVLHRSARPTVFVHGTASGRRSSTGAVAPTRSVPQP